MERGCSSLNRPKAPKVFTFRTDRQRRSLEACPVDTSSSDRITPILRLLTFQHSHTHTHTMFMHVHSKHTISSRLHGTRPFRLETSQEWQGLVSSLEEAGVEVLTAEAQGLPVPWQVDIVSYLKLAPSRQKTSRGTTRTHA